MNNQCRSFGFRSAVIRGSFNAERKRVCHSKAGFLLFPGKLVKPVAGEGMVKPRRF
jgi:hypothetical protein